MEQSEPGTEDEKTAVLSPRQLKAVLAVYEHKTVTKAAKSLSRSQSAITKSTAQLEAILNQQLFRRSSAGTTPTSAGETFCQRLIFMRDILTKIYVRYCEYHHDPAPINHIPLLTMDTGQNRLHMLVRLFEYHSVSATAKSLDITPRAIYAFIQELESQFSVSLFERWPDGQLMPTEFGKYLGGNMQLFVRELKFALEDLKSSQGQIVGNVNIGHFPSTTTLISPYVLQRANEQYPDLHLETREGNINVLLDALACGEVDFILTGLRTLSDAFSKRRFDSSEYKIQELFTDNLRIVGSHDHPLFRKTNITVDDLSAQKWVLLPPSQPAGRVLNGVLQDMGISTDINTIGTASYFAAKRLILESGFLSIMPRKQTLFDRREGLMKEVDIHVPDSDWPIGIILRDGNMLSPGANACLKEIEDYVETTLRRE